MPNAKVWEQVKKVRNTPTHLRALMKSAPTEAMKRSLSNTKIWYTRTNPSDQLCLKHKIQTSASREIFQPKDSRRIQTLKKTYYSNQ